MGTQNQQIGKSVIHVAKNSSDGMTSRPFIGRMAIGFYLVVLLLMFLLTLGQGISLPKLLLGLVFFAGLIPLLTILLVLRLKKEGENFWMSGSVVGSSVFLQYSASVMSAHATFFQSVMFFSVSAVIMIAVMFLFKKKQEQ